MLYKKWTNTLENLCMQYRGIIIHQVIDIETLIDSLLTGYYIGYDDVPMFSTDSRTPWDKQEEFIHSFLSRQNVNLDGKLTSLIFLLEHHCSEYLSEHPSLKPNLRKLVEKRNVFAHMKFNALESNLEKQEIILYKYTTEDGKKKTAKVVMNPDKMDDLSRKFIKSIKELNEAGKILLSAKGAI